MPKEWNSRGYNVKDYWDFVDLNSGLAQASITATITIPAGSMVISVFARVIQQAVNAGTTVFIVGDGDDADGFLPVHDATMNMESAVNTFFGDAYAELGAYLCKLYEASAIDGWFPGKFYAVEDTIDCKSTIASANATVAGIVRVYAHILKLE